MKEVNKIQIENNQRLEALYKQSHKWLMAVAFNITKDRNVADELVGELYLYLAEKCNPALWYLNTFNLMYLHAFIKTRFLNRLKVDKRKVQIADDWDSTDTEYNTVDDERFERAYTEVLDEFKRMERTKLWPASKLAQLYFYDSQMTLEKLSAEIGICKSTSFTQIKKAKLHVRRVVSNPFKPLKD